MPQQCGRSFAVFCILNREDYLKFRKGNVTDNILKDEKETVASCNQCKFYGKKGLNVHMKLNHPRKLKCDECDETFKLNVALETHLESHKKPKMFSCDICDQTFHQKWRLEKRTSGHSSSMKFCHYYNNQIKCLFEENGCMFAHSMSPPCKFKDFCSNSLCQFRHEMSKPKTQSIQEHSFKYPQTSTPII
jgi:hypothetical protein